jgi:ABC-type glycerol-3-phosphate transport system substrate-binding protein
MAACNTGKKEAGQISTFSYWIYRSADSSYYPDYRQNPAVKYILSKKWGKNNTAIDFEFTVPVSGEEANNFNTLLATGDYTDILSLTHYTGSAMDLYKEGIILDITEYVEKYMPNYVAFLEGNPEYKQVATEKIDGKMKYIQLFTFMPGRPDSWGDFVYRRDWIVKYGRNPKDGSVFKGDYTEFNGDGSPNKQTWQDNVVFPSGGSDPIYISDWEWMLDIFTTALKKEGIADGYCMNIYYPGYIETGELVNSFGGGGAHWYKNRDGKAAFGAVTDDFRTYLQCMRTWFAKGWIDKAFPERTSERHFQLDTARVAQGKVGLWYGSISQLIGSLDTERDYTNGMIVYSAAFPINNVYGTADQQFKEPYTFLTAGGNPTAIAISNKAAEKDLPALFSLLDYMYTEEGSLLASIGLNKKQYEETHDELYTKYGLTDGAYYPSSISPDGVQRYALNQIVSSDAQLADAIRCINIFTLDSAARKDQAPTEAYRHSMDQWILYENTGRFSSIFSGMISPDDKKIISRTEINIREFMSKNVPGFILGTKDPLSKTDWDSFVDAVNKYNPDEVTQIYQAILDSL